MIKITEAHQEEAWDHTSMIMSAIAAVGGTEVDPIEFNPYRDNLDNLVEEHKSDIGWLKVFLPADLEG